MKEFITLCFGLLMLSSPAFSQYSLEISVSGIKNNEGKIMLQILDEKEKVVNQQMSTISDRKCTIIFNDFEPGKYAIRYFHDENENGKLDTNALGIPKEGYGFSNNAKGTFGPPPFEKWLFVLNGNKKLVLNISY